MSPVLYLFITNTDGVRSAVEAEIGLLALNSVSWIIDDSNSDLALNHGSLVDAANASSGHEVTVVLPGERVLYLQAQVPGKNIQKVQQAIPYVLEDSIIDDVEDLYFAIKQSLDTSNNQYDVSVVNKDYFESVIKQLENAGIFADSMIADYFLVEEGSTLFFDGERVLYNSTETKFSSPVDSTIQLDSSKFDEGEKLKLVTCSESENSALKYLLKNIDADIESCEQHPLLCLLKTRPTNTINLLQGHYKKKKDWSQAGKTWYPVAALFLIWFVIQGGVFTYDYFDLSKKNKLLNTEITKIYKQTFPKSRRIIDAKAQMKQKLSEIRKRRGQSGSSFSEMLSNSASVFSKTKGLVIKSLRYYDGRINLELQISSLQALDKLSEQLKNEKGYQVEIQNASSGKETVTARLQIEGAAS